MRMLILTGLLAMALLGAVLGAIGVHGSTWPASDGGIQASEGLRETLRGPGTG